MDNQFTLIFAILLFIFKYLLPRIAEIALKDTNIEQRQLRVELIHFPVDLLFVALSGFLPRLFSCLSDISTPGNDYAIASMFIKNLVFSFITLTAIPFCVFGTRIAEKYKSRKKFKKMFIIIVPIYLVAILLVYISSIL